MLVAVRETKRLRSAFSFTTSALIHGAVLAWVALAPLVPAARPSLYEQEIRPYENQIVWYNLNDRLPDISAPQVDPRPTRARARSEKTVVAGPRESDRPPQLIYTPAPEIEARQMLPAPNVVALTPAARPLRDFTVPPDLVRPQPAAASLPDAPPAAIVELKPVLLAPPARLQPRPFTPRAEERAATAAAPLPAAPELALAMDPKRAQIPLLPPIQPARRTFIPPVEAAHAPLPQPTNLPAAPTIEARGAAVTPLPAGPTPRVLRPFSTPGSRQNTPVTEPADFPAAPEIAARAAADATVLPEMRAARVLRNFSAPAHRSEAPTTTAITEAPPVANPRAAAALAIVSLFPAREAAIPVPESSQKAGFSQGPQTRADGGDASGESATLAVPGLLVRSGSKDAQPTLLAAMEPPTSQTNLRAAARSVPVARSETSIDAPVRITAAPDPRLAGRLVYSIAIQMPNVTSYSGSWIVWFAEHEPLRDQPMPNMQAPHPLRKVDPKYFPAALDEKVEGKVRLAAVIRKDGHVERVELLQHLDTRLDQSSLEALAKWEFEPAVRNGTPIDVDAVFEIPFHIAPKVPK
jgi:TonB family protein